jgi:adenine-specific DNA methylase
MSVFRPIHYLGSKLRLLNIIQETIDTVTPLEGGVIDLFSGSGIVSKALSLSRPVCSVDIQAYSRILSSALILPFAPLSLFNTADICESDIYKRLYQAFAPLIDIEKDALSDLDRCKPCAMADFLQIGPLFAIKDSNLLAKDSKQQSAIRKIQKYLLSRDSQYSSIISQYYGGIYFSLEQSVFLDACLNFIDRIPPTSRNIFHAAILSTASDIVNTVGRQFAQPVTPQKRDGQFKDNILRKIRIDRSKNIMPVFDTWMAKYNNQRQPKFTNTVVLGDFKKAFPSPERFYTVYADPPYTRSHYSRYYHVLETMALRDRPKISLSNIQSRFSLSKGIYRDDRISSSFGIRSKAEHEFDELFALCRANNLNLVLSYSPFVESKAVTPRILTIKKLEEFACRHYQNVDIVSCGKFVHSKLTSTDKQLDAMQEAEVLLVARV